MSKSLVIVESPAKAKTIRKYLGPAYIVKASLGHLKDLPKSKTGVNPDAGFRPEYKIIPGKKKILNELVKSAQTAKEVYLALDPDREGEAIAWHICEELGVEEERLHRVLFNEITKKGISEGLGHPHPINKLRFESQQARRILDRLVGYEISPVLWKKVRRGLSAGRVQSVALRLVVEREADIDAFIPEEYWKIQVKLDGQVPPSFVARYHGQGGKKLEVVDGDTAGAIKADLEKASYLVDKVERKERRRKALPPLITSRLQQEMARRYRFTAKRTMMVAQQLYEGIEVGQEGAVGLITYMRTDSVRLSDDAVNDARQYIASEYGEEFLPETPNVFKTKKSAQDAHEAIRPTSTAYPPAKVLAHLSKDQQKLYQVVWERFIACQMMPAVYDQTTVHIAADKHQLRASGSVLKFAGWMAVVDPKNAPPSQAKAGKKSDDESGAGELPMLNQGDALSLCNEEAVEAEQKFTQPPARYTEGTLIRELEDKGIGRPSTYATILSTIQDRRYVLKEDGKLLPSELGVIVADRLVKHFPRILDYDFTASMEESLDKVEDGTQDWVQLLTDFYVPFQKEVSTALKNMQNVSELTRKTDKKCEECGAEMVEKWGRNGRFLACSAYPECKHTEELEENKTEEDNTPVDVKCDVCGKEMVRKRGRYGSFLACSGYPSCKNTQSMPTGIDCPADGCKGELVERRTRKGRTFFGCSEFKKTGCDFVVWGNLVKEDCPQCGAKFLIISNTKKSGKTYRCSVKDCGYTRKDDSDSVAS